jgi:hypothetical protein
MKTIRKIALLMLSILFASSLATAQYKIIVKSKTTIDKLQLRNTATGAVNQIPTWNKTGGGFLLSVADLGKTEIVASSLMEIQLYRIDTKESTTWIQLSSGEKRTLKDCFDIYGNTGNTGKDDMANVSDFFSSVFTGYSVSGTNMVVRGSSKVDFKDAKNNFFTPSEIQFSWKAKSTVEKIYLKNLTTNKLVWMAPPGFSQESLDYAKIAADLGASASENLIVGEKYELQIYLKGEKEPVTQSFNISPAYFSLTNSKSFLSWENVLVNWQENQNPTYAFIVDSDGNALWESDNLPNGKIDYSTLKNNMEVFESGKYQLVLEYNKIKVPFDFEIYASANEVEELKGFITQ